MKKITLTLFTVFLFMQSYGQGIEWSFLANSGLYRYTGSYTVSSTFLINVVPGTKSGYPNNRFGNLYGFSYGAGFQAQYVSKGGFIMGLQTAYDVLRSKENVDHIYRGDLVLTTADYIANYAGIPATGHACLTGQDININPYIGYRIKTKNLKIDLMPGVDMAYNVSLYQSFNAKDNVGNHYQASNYAGTLPSDIRLRFGAAAWYKKYAFTASYAHGLKNFTGYILDDDPSGHYTRSELIRFGLAVRLN